MLCIVMVRAAVAQIAVKYDSIMNGSGTNYNRTTAVGMAVNANASVTNGREGKIRYACGGCGC